MNEEYQHLADPKCKKCEGTGIIEWDGNALLACSCMLKALSELSELNENKTSGEKMLGEKVSMEKIKENLLTTGQALFQKNYPRKVF